MELNLSVLGIFAVLSLIVERIMEVFSESWWFRENKAQIEETKSRMADLQTRIDALAKDITVPFFDANLKCGRNKGYKCLDFDYTKFECLRCERWNKQKVLMSHERWRSIRILLIGFILGIFISLIFNYLFNIKFIELFGIEIGKFWDSFISGMLIGSGTKPMHDIIALIEKMVKK